MQQRTDLIIGYAIQFGYSSTVDFFCFLVVNLLSAIYRIAFISVFLVSLNKEDQCCDLSFKHQGGFIFFFSKLLLVYQRFIF